MMDDKNLNISISARYCKNSPKKDTPRPEGAKQQVKMSNPTRSSPRKEEPDVKKIINVDCSWCEWCRLWTLEIRVIHNSAQVSCKWRNTKQYTRWEPCCKILWRRADHAALLFMVPGMLNIDFNVEWQCWRICSIWPVCSIFVITSGTIGLVWCKECHLLTAVFEETNAAGRQSMLSLHCNWLQQMDHLWLLVKHLRDCGGSQRDRYTSQLTKKNESFLSRLNSDPEIFWSSWDLFPVLFLPTRFWVQPIVSGTYFM